MNEPKNLLERLSQLTEQFNNERLKMNNLFENIEDTISELRNEIRIKPKLSDQFFKEPEKAASIEEIISPIAITNQAKESELKVEKVHIKQIVEDIQTSKYTTNKRKKNSIESFIGGNLIGKLGIMIMLVGIFIGMRYAIERDLIGPIARLMLGYFTGLTLIGTGLFLKKKYLNYSAVLLGGGLAVMYFITYLGYSSYEVIPQPLAFILMLLITGGTVYQALEYKQQVVAHIGLVGAYAIPFLVGNDTGQYLIFLSYTLLVNLGILFLSYRMYWKALLYSAFTLTWLIYLFWYINNGASNVEVAMFFAVAYFIVFYAAILLYKLIKNEEFKAFDSLLILANALIFFGLSYNIYWTSNWGNNSVFITLLNSVIHFGVFALIKKIKPADSTLYFITLGLGLLFVSIAIPMQFDGNWVTLLWALEALLLCFLGCRKFESTYFIFSSLLALFSIGYFVKDIVFETTYNFPVFNTDFLTQIITITAFGGMYWLFNKYFTKSQSSSGTARLLSPLYIGIIPMLMIVSGATMINNEISNAFIDNYQGTEEWLCRHIFSFLYIAALTFANMHIFKSSVFKIFLVRISIAAIIIFLSSGLWLLGLLKENYISGDISIITYLAYRYSMAICIGLGVYLVAENIVEKEKKLALWVLGYACGFIWISNEYLSWTSIMDVNYQARLGLSIIWTCYAVALIIHGIITKYRGLRLAGIVLIGITIIKLFLHDLANANTLTKTIIFIGLGILLLITAYLYNRYKYIILGEMENKVENTENDLNQ